IGNGRNLAFDELLHTQSGENLQSNSKKVEYIETLDELNARHIKMVLQKTKGKVHGPEGAAALLGINASTLRYRMNKLGIPYGRVANG
nr:helix-turn-helix domain-containing protein [Woeseiaceae bacterium]